MKSLLVALVLCAGVQAARPVVDVPAALRQRNWVGSQGEGSCVWASTITLLNWQSRYKTAQWIKDHCGNGAGPEDLSAKLDKLGVRYAYTTSGDVNFLEWCIRTRRGAGVTTMGGAHCENLVHLDAKWAGVLDNNNPNKIKWVPRETFLSEWRASMGWAFTVVYTPAAPLPKTK